MINLHVELNHSLSNLYLDQVRISKDKVETLRLLALKLRQGFINLNIGIDGGNMPVLIGYDNVAKINKIFFDNFREHKDAITFKHKLSL